MKFHCAPILLFLLVTTGLIPAQNHVCFLGITGEGAPGSRQSFEEKLRNVVDTMEGIHLVDYLSTMRYRELIELDRYSRSSRNLLGNLVYHIPDTVLVIWGTLNKIDIATVRKKLLGTEINGSLTASLSVFSLKKRKFSFKGNVTSTVSVKDRSVYLDPVKKTTHLSAPKRAMLTDSLILLAVGNCHDALRSVLKESKNLTADHIDDEQSKNRAPSISDVFTVPSVEARQIERGGPEQNKNGNTTDTEKSTTPK